MSRGAEPRAASQPISTPPIASAPAVALAVILSTTVVSSLLDGQASIFSMWLALHALGVHASVRAAFVGLGASVLVVLLSARLALLPLGVGDAEPLTTSLVTAAQLSVLVLTAFDLDECALGAVGAGASGFLLKNAPPDELLAAARLPVAGEGRERLDQPTDREREVLLALAAGPSSAEIAERLVVAEPTVKSHVGSVLAKLHLRDRVQAVVLAYEPVLVWDAGRLTIAVTERYGPQAVYR